MLPEMVIWGGSLSIGALVSPFVIGENPGSNLKAMSVLTLRGCCIRLAEWEGGR